MIILNEINRPYILDSLTAPLPLRHHWTFNGHILDFTLSEITYLEEALGPTITLVIDDSEVRVPGGWNILIVDRETFSIDAVPVTACAAFEHEAFVFSPDNGNLITSTVRVGKWEPKGTCIYPAIEKAHAMVHPIAPGISHGKSVPRGVIVGPNELWKWIANKTVGDILG